jgi:hypothetical protein
MFPVFPPPQLKGFLEGMTESHCSGDISPVKVHHSSDTISSSFRISSALIAACFRHLERSGVTLLGSFGVKWAIVFVAINFVVSSTCSTIVRGKIGIDVVYCICQCQMKDIRILYLRGRIKWIGGRTCFANFGFPGGCSVPLRCDLTAGILQQSVLDNSNDNFDFTVRRSTDYSAFTWYILGHRLLASNGFGWIE